MQVKVASCFQDAGLTPVTFQPAQSQTNPNGGARYGQNIYTAEQWKVMSRLGAVFLPAAGVRDGTSYTHTMPGISYDGTKCGVYWSTTAYDGGAAYCLYFTGKSIGSVNTGYSAGLMSKYVGCSVRLVYGTSCPQEDPVSSDGASIITTGW